MVGGITEHDIIAAKTKLKKIPVYERSRHKETADELTKIRGGAISRIQIDHTHYLNIYRNDDNPSYPYKWCIMRRCSTIQNGFTGLWCYNYNSFIETKKRAIEMIHEECHHCNSVRKGIPYPPWHLNNK